MSTNQENTIVAIYESHQSAEEAVKELNKSGFDMTKLSLVGKGYHSEEHPVGFYTTGDRMKAWGGIGAFWGGLWGLLMGAAFFWVPGFGPIAVAGPFIHLLIAALEGAAVVGGISALGAALASIGIPKDRVLKFESSLKADKYLLIAHGSAEEVERARSIMQRTKATETEAFSSD